MLAPAMSLSLAALLGYVLLQLFVGVWVSRRIKTEDDYLLGGRTLGPVLVTSSIFATWFGAETCVGAAGEVFNGGLSAVSSDPYGYGLCLVLMGLFVARTLWNRRVTTLADLFRSRYSPVVERVVAVLIIPSSLLWAAAQIRAFGGVVASAGSLDHDTGSLIAVLVVVGYMSFGGLLADAYADVLQGTVLTLGLGTLGVTVLMHVPDLGAAITAGGHAGEAHALLPTLNDWAVPVLGSLFAQELLMRVSGARSATLARNATLTAAVVYMLVGTIPVLLGLVGRSVLPELQNGDQVLPALARHFLGELGFVIFAGALVAAILSTVDSALLACGSLVAHNLLPRALRERNERAPLIAARVSVIALAFVAYGLSHTRDSVAGLVEEASSFGSAGVFVIGALGLGTPGFGGAYSALAALIGGAGSWLYFGHVIESDVAYLASLTTAAAGYVGVALFERRRPAVAAVAEEA
jgi:solute:Na+ symporter, SSS family